MTQKPFINQTLKIFGLGENIIAKFFSNSGLNKRTNPKFFKLKQLNKIEKQLSNQLLS